MNNILVSLTDSFGSLRLKVVMIFALYHFSKVSHFCLCRIMNVPHNMLKHMMRESKSPISQNILKYVRLHSEGENWKELLLDSNEWMSKGFMTNGYQAECRRLRETVQFNCAHHQYSSIKEYVKFTQSLVTKVCNETDGKILYDIQEELDEKIGGGFCPNCAIYVASNMQKIYDQNLRIRMVKKGAILSIENRMVSK